MNISEQFTAWQQTAGVIRELLQPGAGHPLRDEYEQVLMQTERSNPWFTRSQVENALEGVVRLLEPADLEAWMNRYPSPASAPVNVGVIMAGNIPLAGFHDFLSVVTSGHRIAVKLSASDSHLLPFVARIFFSFIPTLKDRLTFVERLGNVDAVIATGSNNTSRYFEYYFGKKPHIFRKNRNSAAVLTGEENEFDLLLLGRDIFTYFGLGCRNVSKLYVPEKYAFDTLFESLIPYAELMTHNKYMNNLDYNQAIYLMNQKPFLTNNFLIVTHEEALASPVSVLHYECYSGSDDLNKKLSQRAGELQCVVSKTGPVPFGQSQFPLINDYADGIDTREFLATLKK